MKKSGMRARVKTVLIVMAAVLVPVYVLVFHWPAGGLRTGFGVWSGTRAPSEARGLTDKQCEEETRARAERIRQAGLLFLADTGRPPTSVSSLVPKYLPEEPRSLISTKPFWIRRNGNARGFNVHWEAWPDAMYETYWIDEKGEEHADM